MRGTRFAVPADLLHVVVELESVAVGIDRKGAVVDAGEELARQVPDLYPRAFEERDRIAQLAIAADLDAERRERRLRMQLELVAQLQGIERHAVVLGVGAQEHAAVAAIVDLDRKSTRLNSSHRCISYAVFC